ncbi:MAG: DUF111 family protein [Eubacterium sp.]|nr:DUF111 family protein [Eubacterium sp.]
MKSLYLDCSAGADSRRIGGALLDLMSDPETFLKKLNSLYPALVFHADPQPGQDFTGRLFFVEIPDHAEEVLPEDPGTFLSLLPLPDKVRDRVMEMLSLMEESRSCMSCSANVNPLTRKREKISLTGSLAAVCLALGEIAPDHVAASAVNVGRSRLCCAHGFAPDPSPDIMHMLRPVPIYSQNTEEELCTPDGAAILRILVDDFTRQPEYEPSKTGVGIKEESGGKILCLRAHLYDTDLDCIG